MDRFGLKDRVELKIFGPKKTRIARLDKNKPGKCFGLQPDSKTVTLIIILK